jgi:CelD/BcsL family acetyltransferase involved in cellulose biosynthesis
VLRVQEIITWKEFEELRPTWNDLLDRCPDATIFQTWEWIASCIQALGVGKTPVCLTVWDADRLVGIAPFEIAGGVTLRRLQFIGTDVSDYLDCVKAPDLAESVMDTIQQWLEQHKNRWHLIHFQNVRAGSQMLALFTGNGYRPERFKADNSYYIELPQTWDAMSERLKSRKRNELSRASRLIERDFALEISDLRGDKLQEGLESLFTLHTAFWRQRGLPGMLGSERKRKFYRVLAKRLVERDQFRLYGMRLNGELQAVDMCFVFKNRMYGYLCGRNPDLVEYGIGKALVAHVIKDAIDLGLSEFDFLRGDEQYKRWWMGELTPTYRLSVQRGILGKFAAASLLFDRKIGYRVGIVAHRLASLSFHPPKLKIKPQIAEPAPAKPADQTPAARKIAG